MEQLGLYLWGMKRREADLRQILSMVAIPYRPEEFGEDLISLGVSMLDLMERHGGIGLAANQVGVDKRIFVSKLQGREDLIAINPVVEPYGDEIIMPEGCLSLPGIFEEVSRPNKVKLTYWKPDGTKDSLLLDGIDARVIQHEVDHLDGIMFFHRISPERQKVVKQLWLDKLAVLEA